MSASRPVSGASRSRLATSSYKSLGLQGAADHGDVLAGEASPRTNGAPTHGDLCGPAQAAATRLQQQKSFAAQKRLERLQLGGIAQTNEGLIRSRPGSAGTPTRAGGVARPAWDKAGGVLSTDGSAGAQAAAAPSQPPPVALGRGGCGGGGAATSSMDEAHLYERVAPTEPGGDAQRQLMARGLAAVYDPTAGAAGGGRDAAPARVVVTDAAAFVLAPAPRAGVVQCVIVREKDGVVGMKNHRYQLFLDDGTHRFLAAARRRKSNAASAYDITTSQSGARDAPGYAGKLRASFLGTEFVLVDGGAKPRADGGGPTGAAAGVAAAAAGLPLRRELAAMSYETNILGTRGPRKMLVAVPAAPPAPAAGITSSSTSSPRAPAPAAPLLDRLKAHAAAVADAGAGPAPQPHAGLLMLRNRTPRWNESIRAFCLNFGGRVTVASVKNFQLSPDDEPGSPVVLQFGKSGDETFTCDFRWPLTPLQAFAICLSSFDSKLACE